MDEQSDRGHLAAESQLDRLDDGESVDVPAVDALGTDEFGVHIDEPEVDEPLEAAEEAIGGDVEVADALDTIAEAFNARDLDAVVELLADDAEVPGVLGNDPANLPTALEGLGIGVPTCLLLRGELDSQVMGVLWEHDGETWWAIAAVHVGDVVDGRVGVLEVSEDPELLEHVTCDHPEVDELDEGARWSEWEDGDGG